MAEKKLTTLLEILNYSAGFLKQNNIENPRLNAELMLSGIMNCSRLNLYLDFEKPLSIDEKEKLKVYLRRRAEREPLQHILGKANFFGYDILVNKNVLIPRQDTEVLVEHLLQRILESGKDKVNVFEIGAGSGCIAVALVSELAKKNVECHYTGLEISKEAARTAEKNFMLHKLINCNIIQSDFLDSGFQINTEYDYLVSNPPYVPIEEYKLLEPEVNKYEPDFAVTDFGNGMKFYNKIFDEFISRKKECFLEIAWNSKEALEKLMSEKGISSYSFFKDYNNNYRVLRIYV